VPFVPCESPPSALEGASARAAIWLIEDDQALDSKTSVDTSSSPVSRRAVHDAAPGAVARARCHSYPANASPFGGADFLSHRRPRRCRQRAPMRRQQIPESRICAPCRPHVMPAGQSNQLVPVRRRNVVVTPSITPACALTGDVVAVTMMPASAGPAAAS
jgi:hypothetical protein